MEQSIGDRVKAIRESRKMSQNQLAKKAGISQAGLSDIENTTKSPNANTLKLIASALGVSVACLMGEKDVSQELSDVYFRFAKDAEQNQIDPDDIKRALEIIKEFRKPKGG